MGKTYVFTDGDGTTVELKFLEEGLQAYRCKVVGGTHPFAQQEKDSTRNVYKSSRILKWDNDVLGNDKSSGVVRQKRRTPAEIQMDNFLDGILLKNRINKLKEEIDVALANNQKAVFMALTKELKKLTKKEVTA